MANFKVDLTGIVDLLSTAIYSTPSVYLRELIQNAVDAITARRSAQPGWQSAGIRIIPADVAGSTMSITDDGIGLTADEITEFLSTVGSSTKRDALNMPARDMIGRFGIGLLSALMVSPEIKVRTRALSGGPSIEWIGRGDGTWSMRELPETLPVGTTVTLSPPADDADLVSTRAVERLARHYARYLPVPLTVDRPTGPVLITEPPAFLSGDRATLIAHGTELLGSEPFDVVPIDVPLTGTKGVAHIVAHPVPPRVHALHTVYCSSMLVSERCDTIAPDWAFFARIVIDSTGLNPTASREQLIDDEMTAITRDAISEALRAWITGLAVDDPLRLKSFVAIHHLGLKALAIHDDRIGPLIAPLMPMETSRGMRTVGEILSHTNHLAYVPTTDQFRQVNALTGRTIINAAYTWDADLLRRLPQLIPGTTVQQISVADVLQALDPVGGPDTATANDLAARASAVLTTWDARVQVRSAPSQDLPSFLLTDPDAIERSSRRTAAGSDRWSEVIRALDDDPTTPTTGTVTLFNWANPLIRDLAATRDDVVFTRCVRLLHLQAILLSGRPLTSEESAGLTETLTDLMVLSIRDFR